MTTRSEKIDQFLAASGWAGAKRAPLAGDASFRRYERVAEGSRQAVLMDAPPPQEDVRPFMRAGNELAGYGMSAPRILAADEAQGFLLLEDLGDDLYSRLLAREPGREAEIYRAATDVLAQLYHIAPKSNYDSFPEYNEALLMRELMLLAEWFLPAVMSDTEAKKLGEEYRALWQKLLASLPPYRKVLVLRDYHADNLLWLPDREGAQRVGLLDFQDAVIGAPAYDMVSFLEDARRDVSEGVVKQCIDHYLAATGQERESFMASYALLGVQRNCKIVGIFVRLCVRDGKPNYLSYLPRVWGHLMRDLQHPLLAELRAWMEKHIAPQWRGVITPRTQAKAANA